MEEKKKVDGLGDSAALEVANHGDKKIKTKWKNTESHKTKSRYSFAIHGEDSKGGHIDNNAESKSGGTQNFGKIFLCCAPA